VAWQPGKKKNLVGGFFVSMFVCRVLNDQAKQASIKSSPICHVNAKGKGFMIHKGPNASEQWPVPVFLRENPGLSGNGQDERKATKLKMFTMDLFFFAIAVIGGPHTPSSYPADRRRIFINYPLS
jgi:hypothetical protein